MCVVKTPLTNRVLRPRLGMRTHDRVFDRGKALPHLGPALVVEQQAEARNEVVPGAHVADARLHRFRQVVVGGGHVGEQGVAADLGDFDRAQDGTHRRRCPPRDVGVPLVLVAARLGALFEAHDVGGCARRDERVLLQIAPQPREREMFTVTDVLVAQKDDLPLQEAAVHFAEYFVGERAAQVDTGDLGADRPCERPDADVLVRLVVPIVGHPPQRARPRRELHHVGPTSRSF